jgi:hypothetical protein
LQVTVTGWGTLTEGGVQPDKLMQVRETDHGSQSHDSTLSSQLQIPVLDFDQCNALFSGALTSNMMCAGDIAGGKDACQVEEDGWFWVAECSLTTLPNRGTLADRSSTTTGATTS